MNRLVKLSAERRKQAEKILLEGKVIPTLMKYGEPEIIGSFALDVMYNPDIDIVVLTPNPQQSALGALNDFISQKRFQKYEYGDFVKFKRANRPQGFIINLHSHTTSPKWEIEIWFLKSITKEQRLHMRLKNKINDTNRNQILQLKQRRATRKLSKHDLSSMDIYRKAIKNMH